MKYFEKQNKNYLDFCTYFRLTWRGAACLLSSLQAIDNIEIEAWLKSSFCFRIHVHAEEKRKLNKSPCLLPSTFHFTLFIKYLILTIIMMMILTQEKLNSNPYIHRTFIIEIFKKCFFFSPPLTVINLH